MSFNFTDDIFKMFKGFRSSLDNGLKLIDKLRLIGQTGKGLMERQEDAIKCVETFIPYLTVTDLSYLLGNIKIQAQEPRHLSYLREISVPPGAGSNWYMDSAYAYSSIMYKLEDAYDQERKNNAEQISLGNP
jgi:hypothetical protein